MSIDRALRRDEYSRAINSIVERIDFTSDGRAQSENRRFVVGPSAARYVIGDKRCRRQDFM